LIKETDEECQDDLEIITAEVLWFEYMCPLKILVLEHIFQGDGIKRQGFWGSN
jgi:hypothetical protein